MVVHCYSEGSIVFALKRVNVIFDDNIKFKRGPEYIGKDREGRSKHRVTLTVEDSRGPGSRKSNTGRRIAAACWHVHGHFIDGVLLFDPNGKIETDFNTIETAADNWKGGERNIGSMARPLCYADACDCGERGLI